jgi:Ion channel
VGVGGWRPGSRAQRRRASHTYAFVLVQIAITYVWIVAAPDEAWADAVLILIESTTLVLAVWASGLAWYRPALLVAVVGAVVALLELLVGGSTVRGIDALLNLGLVLATMSVIAVGVVDQHEINRQSVSGAVCIYLFLGILFSYVYGAEASFGSAAFFAQGTDGTPATRIYFSYVTLATLGYGDYTPAGQPGRSFAVGEALLGQLYLVTVVALLVGRLGLRQRERPESRRADT